MKIIIKWNVNDGYVGKDRPQTTVLDTEDYYDEEEWKFLSEDAKKRCIEDAVQDDFDMKIQFEISDYGL